MGEGGPIRRGTREGEGFGGNGKSLNYLRMEKYTELLSRVGGPQH